MRRIRSPMFCNLVLWAAIALFACACTPSPTPTLSIPPTAMPATEQDFSAYVEKADAKAKEIIDRANASGTYENVGGPFTLEDFDKQVEETARKDREAVV